MSEVSYISSNKLLSALSAPVYQRLIPHFEEVSLVQGELIHQSNEIVTDVYFPHDAGISLVLIFSDKSTTEIALVGNEGMVGLSAILSGTSTNSNSIVQISGKATKLSSTILQQEFNKGEELQKLLLLYIQVQLSQISQIVACQSHHIIEQRLARWLLLVKKATGKDIIPVTQKLISMMLGVRRASVTEAAIALQQAKIITYSRGQIVIIDSQKLESISCECYQKIQDEYNRLLGK